MTEATTVEGSGTEQSGEQQQEQSKVFTQAEVDAIVRDRLKQQERSKFGDYQELKTRAEGARTLEERIGSLESELSTTRAEALRSSIAARFGISTEKGKDGEPSDAELFLTGTDEGSLTAQAQRLSARVADTKRHGNVAPKEGETKTSGGEDEGLREFTRELFSRAE